MVRQGQSPVTSQLAKKCQTICDNLKLGEKDNGESATIEWPSAQAWAAPGLYEFMYIQNSNDNADLSQWDLSERPKAVSDPLGKTTIS